MRSETGLFFARFVRHPRRVGAVAPSSRRLAARAVAPLPDTGEPVVVELGPGTGAFTDAIQERLGGRGYHLAVEVDATFAAVLHRRHPRVNVVIADAARLPELLALRGLPAADVVVSGLPWVAFSPARSARLLAAVASAMTAQAALTTFAYVHTRWAPPARRARDLVLAVRTVAAGDAILSAEVTGAVLDRVRSTGPGSPVDLAAYELTAREIDVLALVGAGLNNSEIAARLYLSMNTVEIHVTNVLAKTGSRDRVQAAILAIRAGLAP